MRHCEDDGVKAVLFFDAMIVLLCLAAPSPPPPRAIHYVIRVSELEEVLEFTDKVLGMKVLRHEENEAACEITCNGDFDNAWSKTMVGYGPESEGYALELTYNYGVRSYKEGNALESILIAVPDLAAAAAAAKELNYVVEDNMMPERVWIIGPDKYRYHLLPRGPRPEPFVGIVFNADEPIDVADWYVDFLGMEILTDRRVTRPVTTGLNVHLAFGGDREIMNQVKLVFAHGKYSPSPSAWDGRNAFALPEKKVREISARLEREDPEKIVHPLRELQEALGTLVIVIIKDPIGLEICLVSSETFDPSVAQATDYLGPDWARREAQEVVAHSLTVGMKRTSTARLF